MEPATSELKLTARPLPVLIAIKRSYLCHPFPLWCGAVDSPDPVVLLVLVVGMLLGLCGQHARYALLCDLVENVGQVAVLLLTAELGVQEGQRIS